MRTAAAMALLCVGCASSGMLTGPTAGDAYPAAADSAIAAYTAAQGEVTEPCARVARSVLVILLPRPRVEELCRASFRPGQGACIGLFPNGWRAYVADDNVSIAGSVDHELRHLLPRCHGHPAREDPYHCGNWWPPGTECEAPSRNP